MFCMRKGGEGLERRGFPQLGRGCLGLEYVGLAMPWSSGTARVFVDWRLTV